MNTKTPTTHAPGTIDRPLTHDPKKQAPMTPVLNELPARTSDAHARRTRTGTARCNSCQKPWLVPICNSACTRPSTNAGPSGWSPRAELQRRAERASLRARRALAMAVMQ